MNELINLIKQNFSAFVEAMFFLLPNLFKGWFKGEFGERDLYAAVFLIFSLAVAVGAIFLCDRLIRKYNLGFPTSVLLAFLVLSLVLGSPGFIILMIAPWPFRYISNAFQIVCIGSPIFNLVLGVIASLGNRLLKHHPKAGVLLLYGAGILYTWVLLASLMVFLWPLINS